MRARTVRACAACRPTAFVSLQSPTPVSAAMLRRTVCTRLRTHGRSLHACSSSAELFQRSDRFPSAVLDLGGGRTIGTYYSYSMCGGDGTSWNTYAALSGIKGKVFKVAIAAFQNVTHFYVDPQTNARITEGQPTTQQLAANGTNLDGIWIKYYEHLAAKGGFFLEYVPVSQGAMGTHKSKWSACAQDVAWGNIDFCIGNTWATETRLEIMSSTNADLLATTDTDQFRLLVPTITEQPTTSFEDSFVAAPFSPGLWGTILFFNFALCLIYLLTDFVVDRQRETTFAALFFDGEAKITPFFKMDGSGWINMRKLIFTLKKTAFEFWAGTAEMFDDFDIDAQKPVCVHPAKMAWAMFIALALAMYGHTCL